jgi:hypothetical protein
MTPESASPQSKLPTKPSEAAIQAAQAEIEARFCNVSYTLTEAMLNAAYRVDGSASPEIPAAETLLRAWLADYDARCNGVPSEIGELAIDTYDHLRHRVDGGSPSPTPSAASVAIPTTPESSTTLSPQCERVAAEIRELCRRFKDGAKDMDWRPIYATLYTAESLLKRAALLALSPTGTTNGAHQATEETP